MASCHKGVGMEPYLVVGKDYTKLVSVSKTGNVVEPGNQKVFHIDKHYPNALWYGPINLEELRAMYQERVEQVVANQVLEAFKQEFKLGMDPLAILSSIAEDVCGRQFKCSLEQVVHDEMIISVKEVVPWKN